MQGGERETITLLPIMYRREISPLPYQMQKRKPPQHHIMSTRGGRPPSYTEGERGKEPKPPHAGECRKEGDPHPTAYGVQQRETHHHIMSTRARDTPSHTKRGKTPNHHMLSAGKRETLFCILSEGETVLQ